MSGEPWGPEAIRSLAVTGEDVVAAVETNRTTDREAVLRVTPPFSGRMRARLHVVKAEDDDATVHVPPTALVESPPAYPTPDVTADELRAREDDDYSVERHRQYHERRVDEWRATLLDHVVDSLTHPAVDHDIEVTVLGT